MSMKILERDKHSSSSRGRSAPGSILVTAVLLAGLVASAFADNPNGWGGSGGGGGGSGDAGPAGGDETVGTPPHVGRRTSQPPPTPAWRGPPPPLYPHAPRPPLSAPLLRAPRPRF